MNDVALQILCKVRRLSQSELARKAGVSRQAVSLWFKQTEPDLRGKTLVRMSQQLGLSVDLLIQPLPLLSDSAEKNRLETLLLWDRLFPTLGDFAVAVVREDPRALARLVQVFGMYAGAGMAGRPVWKKFGQYKRFIRPVRREECERIWELERNHDLN